MSRQEIRMIVDEYSFFYKKVNNKPNYIFKNSDNTVKMISLFIEEFKKINNTKLLQQKSVRKYFEFQFNRLYTKEFKDKNKTIQLSWIMGKNPLEIWKQANKKHIDFIVRKNIKSSVSLVDSDKKFENWKDIITSTNQKEENDKKRFFNEELGYEYCKINTNLYNHKSNNCLNCDFSQDCKNTLKLIYPKIYKVRGY